MFLSPRNKPQLNVNNNINYIIYQKINKHNIIILEKLEESMSQFDNLPKNFRMLSNNNLKSDIEKIYNEKINELDHD